MRAYTDLIQALHHMKWDLEINLRSLQLGEEEESEYRKEWSVKHRAAWDELRKQIDVGEFLYSPNSVGILRAFDNQAGSVRDDSYDTHLMRLQGLVEKCLPEIKASARIDLGLPAIKRRNSN